MLEDAFSQWMQQAGLIKKLQLIVVLSLLLNLALVYELIESRIIPKTVKESVSEELLTNESQISELELRNFVENYLVNFFDLSQSAIDTLANITDKELFALEIRPEMIRRQEMKLVSKFKLDDIFLDSLDEQHAKAICLGRELFNGDYMDRNFSIELIIDTNNLVVQSIPVFRIEQ